MEAYQEQIRITEDQLSVAKARGDEGAERGLKMRLDELKRARDEERNRVMPRRSKGMMVTGIVLSGIGGLGIVQGGALFVLFGASGGRSDEFASAAIVSLIGAGLCLGVGIPLAVVGSRRVRADARSIEVQPTLFAGPGGAGLHVQF